DGCGAAAAANDRSAALTHAKVLVTKTGAVVRIAGRFPDPGVDPATAPAAFVLLVGENTLACLALPQGSFVRRRHGSIFTSSQPVGGYRVRLKRSNATMDFRVTGRSGTWPEGTLAIRFGFSIGDRSAAGAATLKRRGRTLGWP